MVKSKFTPEQKIQIVLESIRTSISTTELCRKHNVHLQTDFGTGSIDNIHAVLCCHAARVRVCDPIIFYYSDARKDLQ